MAPNGPAIKGGCVTWRSYPATSPGTLVGKLSRWQARYGARFCSPGTNFIELYECRGTSLLSGRVLVQVQDALNDYWRGRGISITDLSW
jgi:hypothetical protein